MYPLINPAQTVRKRAREYKFHSLNTRSTVVKGPSFLCVRHFFPLHQNKTFLFYLLPVLCNSKHKREKKTHFRRRLALGIEPTLRVLFVSADFYTSQGRLLIIDGFRTILPFGYYQGCDKREPQSGCIIAEITPNICLCFSRLYFELGNLKFCCWNNFRSP